MTEPRTAAADRLALSLRVVVLVLALSLPALALSVDYVASGALFLLAPIGLAIGLYRGFVADLTPAERWLLLAFAALPAVAILSYVLGVETNVGYRIVGRMLRLLLFVPVFVAVRWARPRREWVGAALALGAILALIVGAGELAHWKSVAEAIGNYRAGLFPEGEASVHITFGVLAALQGFVAAALLWPTGEKRKWARRCLIGLGIAGVLAGAFTSVLAGARGAWVALLAMVLLGLWQGRRAISIRGWAGVAAVFVAAGIAVTLRGGPLAGRLDALWNGVPAARAAFRHEEAQRRERLAVCPNTVAVLRAVARHSRIRGGDVRIAGPSPAWRRSGAVPCMGSRFLRLRATGRGGAFLALRRIGRMRDAPVAMLSVQGVFEWRFGDGPWHAAGRKTPGPVVLDARRTGPGGRLELHVPGARTLRFVPLQSAPGTYTDYWATTSAGSRLAMWRLAWGTFIHAPVLGRGYGSFRSLERAEIARGVAPAYLWSFEHPHNDYLNALYGAGVLGLLAFAALLLGVPWAVRRLVDDAQCRADARPSVAAAVLLAGGIGTAGLTETMFVHSFTTSWYVVVTAAVVAAAAAGASGHAARVSGKPK